MHFGVWALWTPLSLVYKTLCGCLLPTTILPTILPNIEANVADNVAQHISVKCIKINVLIPLEVLFHLPLYHTTRWEE